MSTESPARPANRLAQETSPYLQQHAHNPVDWYPWGEAALERARSQGKPIFLSIGYSACHWCHVMERESFENEAVARILNENYVCIKVDREERPDLDEIYMAATLAMSGQGGWPMNVLLTPELKPYFAGTYFPLEDGPGRPGFMTVLTQLTEVWKERRQELLDQAEKVTQRLRRQFQGQGKILGLEPELLDQAVSELAQRFDAQNGGFGRAPKFPAPANLLMLLRYHARSQDPRVLEMVTRTLDGMAQGGVYDHLGGGFARYSVDERWLVPHFEKMLYDNAQLAWVYLEGYQVTQSPLYREVARETLDFVLRDLALPEGGLTSALDADTEGEEGSFYCWTVAQVKEVLGEDAGQHFCAYYGVTSTGNWEGKNILHVRRPLAQVAAQLGLEAQDLENELQQSRAKLLQARLQRPNPARDGKVITAWNGMMIQALAEGYRILGDARYLEAAEKAAAFVKAHLMKPDGRLLRTCRDGKAQLNGYLEDYALLAEGLLSLYEAGGKAEFFLWAWQLCELMQKHFARPEGGFFDTSHDHEDLVVRHRTLSDGSMPSPQAVAALVLARMSYHKEMPELRQQALATLTSLGKELRTFSAGFCRYLLVLDFCLAGPLQVTWVGPASPARTPLMEALARQFVPNRCISWKLTDQTAVDLPALTDKPSSDQATVYFCQGHACAAPVTAAEDVSKAWAALKGHVRFELHPRVEGFATPQATAGLAQARPKAYRQLGNTGLMVSRLGFGGYRVDDETDSHYEAARTALEGGVNLFDTSTNYTDGGSERLLGALLRAHPQRRSEVVVVTKIGYVQGTNLDVARAREQMGHPYAEMVPYQEGCWHCIHPEFLADQLERSTMRLSLQTLDVLLLHNPEYFLMDAQQRGQKDVGAVREEFEKRLEQAFQYLEAQVAEGRIRYYGVSSNTFAGPENNLTTVSLTSLLGIARRAGGENHHFRVVQVPLNLLEPAASQDFLQEAQAAGLGVLLNRPLNAFVQQTLVRLADFQLEVPKPDLSASLEVLKEVEEEYRNVFGPFVQGPGADQLFRFAENLAPLEMHLQNLEHWTQLEAQRIRPALMEQVRALDEAMTGAILEPWVAWRERYMAAFRDVSNDLEDVALRKSQRLTDSVRELLPQAGAPAKASMSQLACWVLDGLPGVTCVLVGMRQPEYVEDLLPVLDWEVCSDSQQRLKALEAWSNPFGVLA